MRIADFLDGVGMTGLSAIVLKETKSHKSIVLQSICTSMIYGQYYNKLEQYRWYWVTVHPVPLQASCFVTEVWGLVIVS